MIIDLTGRKAIMTGSTAGIGRATAEVLEKLRCTTSKRATLPGMSLAARGRGVGG